MHTWASLRSELRLAGVRVAAAVRIHGHNSAHLQHERARLFLVLRRARAAGRAATGHSCAAAAESSAAAAPGTSGRLRRRSARARLEGAKASASGRRRGPTGSDGRRHGKSELPVATGAGLHTGHSTVRRRDQADSNTLHVAHQLPFLAPAL